MQIEILHVSECPNLGIGQARLTEAMAAIGASAHVSVVEVRSASEAEARGMAGSPTFLADGRDLFGATEPSLACRLYREGDAIDGAPSVDALVDALRQANDG